MHCQKGVAPIFLLIILAVFAAVCGLIIYFGGFFRQSLPPSESIDTSALLKTEYENPFSASPSPSGYQNPFKEEYTNPFDISQK